MPGASAGCVLPAAPPPSPGELLASWIGRLACLYDAPPQDLCYELVGSAPAEFGWNGSGRTIGGQLLEQFSRDVSGFLVSGLLARRCGERSAAIPAAPLGGRLHRDLPTASSASGGHLPGMRPRGASGFPLGRPRSCAGLRYLRRAAAWRWGHPAVAGYRLLVRCHRWD